MPDRAVFDQTYWEAYTRVNMMFATRTIEAVSRIQDTDTVPVIWIHDYHLMLAATTIR